jgi:hypothetical protein
LGGLGALLFLGYFWGWVDKNAGVFVWFLIYCGVWLIAYGRVGFLVGWSLRLVLSVRFVVRRLILMLK